MGSLLGPVGGFVGAIVGTIAGAVIGGYIGALLGEPSPPPVQQQYNGLPTGIEPSKIDNTAVGTGYGNGF